MALVEAGFTRVSGACSGLGQVEGTSCLQNWIAEYGSTKTVSTLAQPFLTKVPPKVTKSSLEREQWQTDLLPTPTTNVQEALNYLLPLYLFWSLLLLFTSFHFMIMLETPFIYSFISNYVQLNHHTNMP